MEVGEEGMDVGDLLPGLGVMPNDPNGWMGLEGDAGGGGCNDGFDERGLSSSVCADMMVRWRKTSALLKPNELIGHVGPYGCFSDPVVRQSSIPLLFHNHLPATHCYGVLGVLLFGYL